MEFFTGLEAIYIGCYTEPHGVGTQQCYLQLRTSNVTIKDFLVHDCVCTNRGLPNPPWAGTDTAPRGSDGKV